MNEAAKAQAEALFKRREVERAEFEAQLQAQRDKAQRLRALRLAREEARWVEHRPKVIGDIKEGLVTLHEKTAEMRTKHPERS
jgi:predicted RNase H-like nuclease